MPYKKGDKFTIEITDVMTGEDGKTVYRMNDFSSLVFDQRGLDRLKKAEEPVEPDKNSFERIKYGDEYFFISAFGTVITCTEMDCGFDGSRFETANYCTDKSLMEQRALHETLNRLLWRYSEEHGGDNEWDMKGQNDHWYICGSPGAFAVDYQNFHKRIGNVYFAESGIAYDAIRDIVEPFMAEHPEFVW